MGVVAMHAFNPNTAGGRGRGISAFEASLVYRASFWTARATQIKIFSKKKKKKDCHMKTGVGGEEGR